MMITLLSIGLELGLGLGLKVDLGSGLDCFLSSAEKHSSARKTFL